MRRSRRILALLGLIAVAGLTATGLHLWSTTVRPGPLPAAVSVIIPRGASVAAIAYQLDRREVISNTYLFRLLARTSGVESSLRAGEYAFSAGVSMREVLRMLREGETVVRKITVPEGWTVQQVVALLLESPGLEGPVAPPREGTVLPETYQYTWGDSREDVLRRMSVAMHGALDELWRGRAADLPIADPDDAVVLASVVEKETALPAERPRVAAVFLNRLRAGMRLQADPTVVYAIWGGNAASRPLTLADLQFPSAYNTYVSDGLPPGPIANPGRAALQAVLQPAQTDELYFVADGSGGHAFARTLAEHQRNVLRWRKLNAQDGAGGGTTVNGDQYRP